MLIIVIIGGIITITKIEKTINKVSYVDININGESVRLDVNKMDNPSIELSSLNCDSTINVSRGSNACYDVYFDNTIVTDKGIEYQIKELDKNYAIPITVVDKNSASYTFWLQTWPSSVPSYTVVGKSIYEGDYYLTLIGGV